MTRHCRFLTGIAILLGPITVNIAQASVGQPSKDGIPVEAAAQACRAGRFDTFFRFYIQSPIVRERFTASQVLSAPVAGNSEFISRSEFLSRFPLALHGWNYAIAGTQSEGVDKQYVLPRMRHFARTVWRVDWIEARFDTTSTDGKWIGVPVELTGMPKRLNFVATDDGCWHLTDEVTGPKDSPFQPGIQFLHCSVRADDYRRELRRIESRLDDHPDDMDIGRDLAACAKLQNLIASTIRADAELTRLRHDIERRLAVLGAQQSPAARAALALDEQQFRRRLMRDKYLLMDRSAGNRDLRDDLATWQISRLEILGRTEPRRNDFAGAWHNVGGEIDVRRLEDGSYRVDASLVDPEFLAWGCDFDETMPRSGNTLSLTYPRGDSIHLTLRNGILFVEQDGTGSNYCGAGGSLRGAYFPMRPGPDLPPQIPIP